MNEKALEGAVCGLIFHSRSLWTRNRGQHGPRVRKQEIRSLLGQQLAPGANLPHPKSFLSKANRNVRAQPCSRLFQSQEEETMGFESALENIGVICLLYTISDILRQYAVFDYRKKRPWSNVSCMFLTYQ